MSTGKIKQYGIKYQTNSGKGGGRIHHGLHGASIRTDKGPSRTKERRRVNDHKKGNIMFESRAVFLFLLSFFSVISSHRDDQL